MNTQWIASADYIYIYILFCWSLVFLVARRVARWGWSIEASRTFEARVQAQRALGLLNVIAEHHISFPFTSSPTSSWIQLTNKSPPSKRAVLSKSQLRFCCTLLFLQSESRNLSTLFERLHDACLGGVTALSYLHSHFIHITIVLCFLVWKESR